MNENTPPLTNPMMMPASTTPHITASVLSNNVVKGAAIALLHKPDYDQQEIAVNVCALAELMKAAACGNLILSYTLHSNVQGLDSQSQEC